MDALSKDHHAPAEQTEQPELDTIQVHESDDDDDYDDYDNDYDNDNDETLAQPDPSFHLTVQLHNRPIKLPFWDDDSTIKDLSETVAAILNIPPSNQKLLITPKIGLLKPPFSSSPPLLRTLRDKKIVLLGATAAELETLEADIAEQRALLARRAQGLAGRLRFRPERRRDWRRARDDARYTFHTLRPLAHLPDPARSQRFLERLRDDPGVRAAMRARGFSVGLLTEMDPAAHTTHESRTLGLNRNGGEVIELRLRTDAYDGYRDYRVIRHTLCHELAHNVWGEHDARFWKLCKEIEADVERNDWKHGGHSVGRDEFYNPDDRGVDDEDGDFADHGGWTGGEYVLGGGGGGGEASGSAPVEPVSRRQVLADAAEERMRKQREARATEKEDKGSGAA